MAKPRLLYSTNARVAYQIAKKFYGDIHHHVWCAPTFDLAPQYMPSPPSSMPRYRYKEIHSESRAGDSHGALILTTKEGLLSGADKNLTEGRITLTQRDEIRYYVSKAGLAEYKPLLYVMVYDEVKHLAKLVPIDQRANPLFDEYIIEELPRSLFEVLDLEDL